MRIVVSFIVGSLFGLGLLVSVRTYTTKVQGWLDLFGDWDPTLAFGMGGASVPMTLAWQFAKGRRPWLADTFPAAPEPRLGRNLVVGSTLFGMGWGLAGLCPGPAIASLSFGGTGGVLFVAAMAAGMFAAPPLKARLDQAQATV